MSVGVATCDTLAADYFNRKDATVLVTAAPAAFTFGAATWWGVRLALHSICWTPDQCLSVGGLGLCDLRARTPTPFPFNLPPQPPKGDRRLSIPLLSAEINDDRFRLWIDNSVTVNAWSSVSGAASFQTVLSFDTANSLHDILIEYWHLGGAPTSVDPVFATMGSVITVTPFRLPSTRLYSCPYDQSFSPVVINVLPAATDLRSSNFSGSGISIASAGVLSSFRITVRDAYGNLRTQVPSSCCFFFFLNFERLRRRRGRTS